MCRTTVPAAPLLAYLGIPEGISPMPGTGHNGRFSLLTAADQRAVHRARRSGVLTPRVVDRILTAFHDAFLMHEWYGEAI